MISCTIFDHQNRDVTLGNTELAGYKIFGKREKIQGIVYLDGGFLK